jgi:thiamine biosynthesis lipoprotein
MNNTLITRRRFITLTAAAVGLPIALHYAGTSTQLARWEGTALGAPASIQLYHRDAPRAQRAINAALIELQRLENIFSLYQPNSALSTLNRQGFLLEAPHDLWVMTQRALSLAQISDGVYDPTVQPLWQLYFNHFSATHPNPEGPSEQARKAALALVNWRDVELNMNNKRIALARPAMGLTLNAGAQGYITDRIAELLRAYGFDRMLVDMGEPRALSTKPDGSAWRIAIANPANTQQAITTLDVVDECVATSGGYGTLFDDAGRFTHLFNTRNGLTAPALLGVSVIADTGIAADGLSATMLLIPENQRQAVLTAGGGKRAIFVTPEGIMATVEATPSPAA